MASIAGSSVLQDSIGPIAALLTDSPDFHLRLARHLKRLGIPVFYLVAPQVWAWRQNRVETIRRLVDQLYCLFPFEETWFQRARSQRNIYRSSAGDLGTTTASARRVSQKTRSAGR